VTTAGHVTGLRQAAILVAAGAVEGAMLGWAQATVLRRVVTGLDTRSWVRATALGAVVAYAMGMVPSLFFPLPVPAMVAIAAVAGTVLLGSIGTAQWLVLRRHRPGSAWWIAATAGAWLLGLAAFLAIATPLWQPGQPAALIVAIAVLAGLVMAAVVAAVTGWAVLRLRTTWSVSHDGTPSRSAAVAGVDDGAAVGDHDAGPYLVGQVDRQLSVAHHFVQQRGDVATVRAGGGARHAGR
jgi:hypothetical protein